MSQGLKRDLLKDRRVIEEINRHLWIESEKAGYDIGFEQAAEDWLKNFSSAWMDYHVPPQKQKSDESVESKKSSSRKTRTK